MIEVKKPEKQYFEGNNDDGDHKDLRAILLSYFVD